MRECEVKVVHLISAGGWGQCGDHVANMGGLAHVGVGGGGYEGPDGGHAAGDVVCEHGLEGEDKSSAGRGVCGVCEAVCAGLDCDPGKVLSGVVAEGGAGEDGFDASEEGGEADAGVGGEGGDLADDVEKVHCRPLEHGGGVTDAAADADPVSGGCGGGDDPEGTGLEDSLFGGAAVGEAEGDSEEVSGEGGDGEGCVDEVFSLGPGHDCGGGEGRDAEGFGWGEDCGDDFVPGGVGWEAFSCGQDDGAEVFVVDYRVWGFGELVCGDEESVGSCGGGHVVRGVDCLGFELELGA